MVPAIVYNQRIYQGREAFQWFNKFTSTKSFTPLGTEKKDIAFTFLDGSENTTDSFSTKLGQGPQGPQGPQGTQILMKMLIIKILHKITYKCNNFNPDSLNQKCLMR